MANEHPSQQMDLYDNPVIAATCRDTVAVVSALRTFDTPDEAYQAMRQSGTQIAWWNTGRVSPDGGRATRHDYATGIGTVLGMLWHALARLDDEEASAMLEFWGAKSVLSCAELGT